MLDKLDQMVRDLQKSKVDTQQAKAEHQRTKDELAELQESTKHERMPERKRKELEALERKLGSYTVTAPGATDATQATTTFFVLDEVGSRLGMADAPATAGEQPEPQAEGGEAEPPPAANYKCLVTAQAISHRRWSPQGYC